MTVERRNEAMLRRMRWYSTSLLVLMVCVYFVARYFERSVPDIGFVRAFAEAATIGGLADWFAVTAIFRHPLGLPLPHTAIIPTNKERIAEELGAFVQKNFLTPEAVREKVESADIAGWTAAWLANPRNCELVSEEIRAFLPKVLEVLEAQEVKEFVRANAVKAVSAAELQALAGEFLELLTAHNRHQELFDEVLRLVGESFEEFKPSLRSRIRRESGILLTLLGGDAALYTAMITVVAKTLDEAAADPDHELRQRYSEAMQAFIRKIRTSPEYSAKIEEIRQEMLESPAAARYFDSIWRDLKEAVSADLAAPGSLVRDATREAVRRMTSEALPDPAVRETLNDWVRSVLVDALASHGEEMRALIADRVKEWDTDTLVGKFEVALGKDLQFIRINGTLIGGLIGLLIHCISLLY